MLDYRKRNISPLYSDVIRGRGGIAGGNFLSVNDAEVTSYIVHSGKAQTGTASTITLASTASSVDDYYNDMGVVLIGGTGSGKTYTAMRLASGIAGDKPFVVIDTEAGRAKHYADSFKFDHGDLKAPFRPDAYADAIKAADGAEADAHLATGLPNGNAARGSPLADSCW